MKIRFRDKKGRFISIKKAKRLKIMKSEIYDEKTKRKIGQSVKGFYPQIKKLAREALPKVQIKKQKEYTPRRKAKPKQIVPSSFGGSYLEYDSGEYEELEDEEISELEDEWQDEWEEGFGELDSMDDLEDLLTDEDEWYES